MIQFYAMRGPRLVLDPASVLDIGSLDVGGIDVSPGDAIPDDGDSRIDRSLRGFLFTCGPDHIRHPEPIGDGSAAKYPLHGSFSSHPAEVLSLDLGGPAGAKCQALVKVNCADGNVAQLDRQWRIDGQTGEVHLRDIVTNTGEKAFPAFLMYHMNIAGRLLDDRVRLAGAMLEDGGFPWTFGEADGGIFCVPAGKGGSAEIRLGPIASLGGRTLAVRFRTDTLPYLQMWRNQRAPANVLGIEPVSHRWEGRAALGERGELVVLAPGESREYGLSFAFV